MFSLFQRNPTKKLKKKHSILLEKAMFAQRIGDIRTYSMLTAEAEELYKQIDELSLSKTS